MAPVILVGATKGARGSARARFAPQLPLKVELVVQQTAVQQVVVQQVRLDFVVARALRCLLGAVALDVTLDVELLVLEQLFRHGSSLGESVAHEPVLVLLQTAQRSSSFPDCLATVE